MSQKTVYEVLKKATNPLTAEEIAAEIDVALTTARASIKRLRMRREVQQIKLGRKSRYELRR